eukprot:762413-Hanusia_phi.AAC.2
MGGRESEGKRREGQGGQEGEICGGGARLEILRRIRAKSSGSVVSAEESALDRLAQNLVLGGETPGHARWMVCSKIFAACRSCSASSLSSASLDMALTNFD